MEGMRFVISLSESTPTETINAYVPIPFDCHLVGVMASGPNPGFGNVVIGYIDPDGNDFYVDEGVCVSGVPLSSQRYWSYSEFTGTLHDGKNPFRCPAGSTLKVEAGYEDGAKFVGLVFVEG